MAYYCTALPVIMGTLNKNIIQHNDTVAYFSVFYKNLSKLPTIVYTPITTPNFSKFVYSAEISKTASYRPISGQMWPRASRW